MAVESLVTTDNNSGGTDATQHERSDPDPSFDARISHSYPPRDFQRKIDKQLRKIDELPEDDRDADSVSGQVCIGLDGLG